MRILKSEEKLYYQGEFKEDFKEGSFTLLALTDMVLAMRPSR